MHVLWDYEFEAAGFGLQLLHWNVASRARIYVV